MELRSGDKVPDSLWPTVSALFSGDCGVGGGGGEAEVGNNIYIKNLALILFYKIYIISCNFCSFQKKFKNK